MKGKILDVRIPTVNKGLTHGKLTISSYEVGTRQIRDFTSQADEIVIWLRSNVSGNFYNTLRDSIIADFESRVKKTHKLTYTKGKKVYRKKPCPKCGGAVVAYRTETVYGREHSSACPKRCIYLWCCDKCGVWETRRERFPKETETPDGYSYYTSPSDL